MHSAGETHAIYIYIYIYIREKDIERVFCFVYILYILRNYIYIYICIHTGVTRPRTDRIRTHTMSPFPYENPVIVCHFFKNIHCYLLDPCILVDYFVLGGYLAAVERPLPQSPPASARHPQNIKITKNTNKNQGVSF